MIYVIEQMKTLFVMLLAALLIASCGKPLCEPFSSLGLGPSMTKVSTCSKTWVTYTKRDRKTLEGAKLLDKGYVAWPTPASAVLEYLKTDAPRLSVNEDTNYSDSVSIMVGKTVTAQEVAEAVVFSKRSAAEKRADVSAVSDALERAVSTVDFDQNLPACSDVQTGLQNGEVAGIDITVNGFEKARKSNATARAVFYRNLIRFHDPFASKFENLLDSAWANARVVSTKKAWAFLIDDGSYSGREIYSKNKTTVAPSLLKIKLVVVSTSGVALCSNRLERSLGIVGAKVKAGAESYAVSDQLQRGAQELIETLALESGVR
jgi:hypothetical protein